VNAGEAVIVPFGAIFEFLKTRSLQIESVAVVDPPRGSSQRKVIGAAIETEGCSSSASIDAQTQHDKQ